MKEIDKNKASDGLKYINNTNTSGIAGNGQKTKSKKQEDSLKNKYKAQNE